MRERSGRRDACGIGDASQRSEHATGEQPAAHEAEHEQEPEHGGGDRSEVVQQLGVAAHHEDHARVHTARQREVPGREQHGTRKHDEARVAQRELEANAQPGRT